MEATKPDTLKGAFTVPEFAAWAGISRTRAFAEIKALRLFPRKCGRATLVPRDEAERWLQGLPLRQAS
ncbi:helix-turn-helix domain-containing protein [Geothrix sp. SG200]|uniref:helix-turn-helix domain-containing protein n=1 Tax=Geothrix sp. SG200 TaxID=2922865 RepID=UPI001FAC9549|nr:helix-turn-helix domain-containing protein [Geothrix sp. SG200]